MDMDRYIGRLLDNRYEILEVLGTGGMAVVYKARCHRLNRLVAIKILREEYTQDEEFRRRFHAESQAVAMLSHPNIVSVYDVSTSDEADYIVMELIDGITLKQYMEKKSVLNWKETLHFAIQIAKALDHAHSRGIIHRDIKPHNVMVLRNGSVKVTDFGIARVMSESNTLTKEALGSVHYISPEQAKGGHVDNRSDLYSLGVVMYEMMAGKPPYDGESPVSVAIQHISGKPTMPSVINPNIPGGLEQIIMRTMARNPADRYPTASAMLQDMDEFRKNPAILFDYNNPDSDIDAATRMQPRQHDPDETLPLPKTVAERTVEKKPQPKPRVQKSAAPVKKPTNRREVIVEEKEERSKVATIAIVACALVAFVAIILLGIAIFGSDALQSNSELTVVPNLIGEVYDQSKVYDDIVLRIGNRQHSDTYAKGEIMEQTPSANKRITKGGTVTIVISLGPATQDKVMEILEGVPEKQAKEFLEDMELDLKILVHTENNATVSSGCVIRTDPAEGEALQKGQTVHLWISTGPVRKTAKVPDVVGYSLDMATKLMTGSGFNNVEYVPVDGYEEENTVVKQSVLANLEVDVNTQIVLEVSKGNLVSSDPETPTQPTEPDNSVEQVVSLKLPTELEKDAVLSIWNGTELVEERDVYVGTFGVQVKLRGEGVVVFTAMLDNNASTAWQFEVDFAGGDPDGL